MWRDFVSWCSRLGKVPTPSSGHTIAAYLVERCSELDEDGRFAHGLSRFDMWIDVIDAEHVKGGWDEPSSSPEVRTVRELFHRASLKPRGPRGPSSAELLQRVMREVKRTDQSVRDRAMILLSVLGPTSADELARLTVDQISFAVGDGVLLSLEDEEVWVGSIDVPWLCAPCALINWLDLVIARQVGYRGDSAPLPPMGPSTHPCVERWGGLEQIPSGVPLFPEIDRNRTTTSQSLGPHGVRERIRRRFRSAGVSRSAVSGAREELFIERLVHEVGLRSR